MLKTMSEGICSVFASSCSYIIFSLVTGDSNIWYVSESGSDQNNCHTSSTPCRNLQTVLDRAADHADIHVTSETLSLDAVHGFVWHEGHPTACCEVNSSASYSISGFASSFAVKCTGLFLYFSVEIFQAASHEFSKHLQKEYHTIN